MVFDRNELKAVIVWPVNGKVVVSLVNEDGEILASHEWNEPVSGNRLAEMVPEGVKLDLDGFILQGRNGGFARMRGRFDTDVNPERRVVTLEERLGRIERMQRALAAQQRADDQRDRRDQTVIEDPETERETAPETPPQREVQPEVENAS